jgi:hypothetical protein
MREMLSSMAMITATQLKGICFDSSWMTAEMTHRGSYHLSSSKHGKSSMTIETKMKCSLYTLSFSPTSVPTERSILLLSFDLSTKLLHLQYRDSHGIFVPVENRYTFTKLISECSAQSLANGCLHTLLGQVWWCGYVLSLRSRSCLLSASRCPCFLVTKRRCEGGPVVLVTLGLWDKILMYDKTLSITSTIRSDDYQVCCIETIIVASHK